MILSSTGQNIYPEELEAVINNQEYVAESLVVDRSAEADAGGTTGATKLYALVYLNPDELKKDEVDEKDIPDLLNHMLREINHMLPNYSQITKIELVDVPFEKTPKMSIKRYLYT